MTNADTTAGTTNGDTTDGDTTDAGTTDGRRGARIVVGVDGSASSHEALRWALRQAALVGADVEVVACWHRSAMATAFVPLSYASTDANAATDLAARESLAKVLTDLPEAAHVTVELLVVEGHPAQVLVDSALGAELLVVGSHGHGELSGMALGSVGLHCVTHAPCPVLVLRDVPDPLVG